MTQFATARIGLILVNINPAYRLTELEYALNKVGCKALVTAAAFKTSDYLGMIDELVPEIAKAAPGRLKAQTLAGAEDRHPHGRGEFARHVGFRQGAGHGRPGRAATGSTLSADAAA